MIVTVLTINIGLFWTINADANCNTTLTTPSAWFTSPNFPGDYPANAGCFYLITASSRAEKADSEVHLRFHTVSLNRGNDGEWLGEGMPLGSDIGDYVRVYDGNTTTFPMLAELTGGSDDPTDLTSSTGNVLVVFSSNYQNQAQGFNASYSVKSCPMKVLQARHGEIQSPGYPDVMDEANCSDWFIHAPDNQGNISSRKIAISFSNLDLPNSGDLCSSNYVHIGPAPDLKFCGGINHGLPRTYLSERDHVWVKYRYSGNTPARGFSLQFIAASANDCESDEFTCHNGGCILKEWHCNGVADCTDGSDEEHCRSRTTSPKPSVCHPGEFWCRTGGCVFAGQHCDGQVDCTDGSDEEHCGTSVDVYTTDEPLQEKECKTVWCLSMDTSQYQCLADAQMCNGKHDCAKYEDESPIVCYSTCNKTLTAPSGQIMSPSYPATYPASTHCHYLISMPPDTSITLTFADMSLVADSYALGNDDYIEVYDGPSASSRLLARYVDFVAAPLLPLVSSSNSLYVVLHTDQRLQDTGFSANYTTKECDMYEEYAQRSQLQSRDLPSVGTLPQCTNWTIQRRQKDAVIVVSITFLDLPARNSSCLDNYLLLGPEPLLRLCGEIDTPGVYRSSSNTMWIKYKYDGRRAGRGMLLEYFTSDMSTRPGQCLADEFECASGGCILARWKCNGANECPDGSDEAHCTGVNIPPNPADMDCSGYSSCPSSIGKKRCLFNWQWCDGVTDCKYGQDKNVANCNSFFRQYLEGPVGSITSPLYPSRYPASLTVEYFLHVVQGWTIQLRPVDFWLPKYVEHQETDSLYIYDGADKNATIIGRYMGFSPPPSLIESTSNRMYLLFVSNGANQGNGFNITFQKKGVCLGGQKPCGLGEKNCYSARQQCDGTWNCPYSGGDERGCRRCKENSFPCGASAVQCYNLSDRCNGIGHCLEAADEKNCSPELCGPHNGTFLCDDGRCIYESWQCDGAADCTDGSDEHHCSVLPSVHVITAAVLGSVTCGALVVLALACARHLHYLRLYGPTGYHRSPVMQIQDHIYARRSAPPLYDEAMATSRPYEEARREYLERLQRGAGGAEDGGGEAQGGTTTMTTGEAQGAIGGQREESRGSSGSSHQMLMHDSDIEEDEQNVTVNLQNGVQWRRAGVPKREDEDTVVEAQDNKQTDEEEEEEVGETEESSINSSIITDLEEESIGENDQALLLP